MDKKELQVIAELMDKLQEQMDPSEDDFAERLGRKKPGIEVVKVEGKMEDPDMEHAEEELGMDLDHDMEEGESPEHQAKVLGGMGDEDDEDMLSPEESLKRRIMKMRG